MDSVDVARVGARPSSGNRLDGTPGAPVRVEQRAMTVVLVTPPIFKACEPLLGVATLKAYLAERGHACEVFDANVEGQAWLLERGRAEAAAERLAGMSEPPARAAKLLRAWPSLRRKLDRHKAALRSPEAYADLDRYRTAVTSLNRVLGLVSAGHQVDAGSPVTATLTDYLDARYCDMDSASVLAAARAPETNLFHDYFVDELIPRIAALKPSVVGLSLIFRNQLLCGAALATLLRRALPGVHVTLGGELVSAWVDRLETTHLMDLADSVVPYEGELPLLALAEGRPLAEVPNLCWRDDDGVLHKNPTEKVATLAEVPTPDFGFAPWDLYFAPERTAPMVSARGCYWNRCTFCPEVINPESKLRIARGDDLTRQLDEVHARHGVTMFHFIDSAMPAKALRAIAAHVVEEDRPYRWYGFSRLEPYLFADGFAETLYAGGCRMLKLGLETASQRLLDAMDKHQDVGDVGRVLTALHGAGILVHAFLMFGTPFEEEEDAESTRRFVAEHGEHVQFMNCSLMNLAHGSPMGVAPERHGIRGVEPFVIPGHTVDLALYSNFEATGWGRQGARRYLHKRFLTDPRVRPAYLRTPPHFDSNHSVFFHGQVFAGA